ncbi:MAG TPA: SPASM domain-containing protein, partial [Myxococcota bacterium]|nr:SPASM domain-containing protein [Myxococcota bacterium]
EQSLQTNGLLLDAEWCRWLAEEEVLVGLSIDGPEALHDAYRVDRRGRGSFAAVIQAAQRLREAGAAVNAMVTVHAANVGFPSEIYHFLRDDLQLRHLQFVPVVEPVEGGVSPRSVPPAVWGRFLRTIFDLWLATDVGRVFVPTFDAALAAWSGLEPALCIFRARCGGALALEHNGDLYACDHFVNPEHLRGNILEQPVASLAQSPAQVAFGAAKEQSLPGRCRACPVLFACRGECPKNRILAEPDGMLNYLCAGYLDFFTHIDAPMRMMAELLHQDRAVPAVMALRRAAVEGLPRQAPCPCESGRKYRHCHGSEAAISARRGGHS